MLFDNLHPHDLDMSKGPKFVNQLLIGGTSNNNLLCEQTWII